MITVIDERYVAGKIGVLLQDTETAKMHIQFLEKGEIDKYNRNIQADVDKLWAYYERQDND